MAIVNSRAAIEPKTGKAAIFVNETIPSLMRKLFSNGEQGFFYDPNDLSTMFQDAAGTVPVTAAGQAVGLVLDKSQGLVLGAEKIINGDFDNGTTGWVSGTNWTATLGTSTDALTITTNSAKGYGCAIQAVPLVAGKTYKITGKYRSSQGGNAAIGFGLGTGAVVKVLVSSTTSVEFVEFSAIFTHTSGSLLLYNNTAVNGVVSEFKNVSIKEIAGNHAYQTTSASRPILQDAPRRIDFDTVDDKLITNLSAQLTGCTVIRAVPNVGTQILTGQAIPATYEDNKDHCGLIVINRALTPNETSAITAEFNKRAGV